MLFETIELHSSAGSFKKGNKSKIILLHYIKNKYTLSCSKRLYIKTICPRNFVEKLFAVHTFQLIDIEICN